MEGYGIPIELFGPFVEVCVDVMRPMVQEFENLKSVSWRISTRFTACRLVFDGS